MLQLRSHAMPVILVLLEGCCSKSNGPATTLSSVGAPGVSAITAKIIPLLSNAAGMVEEFVLVSNGIEMLFTPWKKTA